VVTVPDADTWRTVVSRSPGIAKKLGGASISDWLTRKGQEQRAKLRPLFGELKAAGARPVWRNGAELCEGEEEEEHVARRPKRLRLGVHTVKSKGHNLDGEAWFGARARGRLQACARPVRCCAARAVRGVVRTSVSVVVRASHGTGHTQALPIV
jgi:hypothetical protein